MAKRVCVSECKPGHFYKVRGWEHLFFCTAVDTEGCYARLQQVGSDFLMSVYNEKAKPVDVYMLSK